MFDHISKHLKVRQKYSAARRIFNSLLGVWKCGQTRSFVFDILHDKQLTDDDNNNNKLTALLYNEGQGFYGHSVAYKPVLKVHRRTSWGGEGGCSAPSYRNLRNFSGKTLVIRAKVLGRKHSKR